MLHSPDRTSRARGSSEESKLLRTARLFRIIMSMMTTIICKSELSRNCFYFFSERPLRAKTPGTVVGRRSGRGRPCTTSSGVCSDRRERRSRQRTMYDKVSGTFREDSAMPEIERMTITMPPELAAVVRQAVETGDYASTSEVVRAALRDWKLKRALQIEELGACPNNPFLEEFVQYTVASVPQ